MISYDLSRKYVGDKVIIFWSGTASFYDLEYFNGIKWFSLTTTSLTQFEHILTHPNSIAQYRVRGDGGEWEVGSTFLVYPARQMRGYVDIIGVGDSGISI